MSIYGIKELAEGIEAEEVERAARVEEGRSNQKNAHIT